ncbi:MAG TPA: PKD domain-containing protein, partial [Fibrobacteria bacterium]|nr:PKD domain-containing protein [Fibrobacteria bacterium]
HLSLKPLPARVDKGDTVAFDLRGTAFPAWAAPQLSVRFDYEGDGTWDTDPLPLAANLAHRHAYASAGRFSPRVEAHYRELESRTAEGRIDVVSSVTPVLKISPDTVEPGGALRVDASESKGDGRLAFSLDLDGDGKPEWIDSASGKGVLKAPGSGTYEAALTARNPMGQEGRTVAMVRVNAGAKLDFKVKNPRENMAAAVELKARAKDADDSLVRVRINFTGDANGWETRTAPPDSLVSAHEWWLRFKHAYGKTGRYAASVCILSADGREVCGTAPVEIFNAPPECRPGPDLRATLGKPLEIDGSGADPDGKIVKWEWDLDGDGKYDLVSAADGKFSYTFSKEGVFPLVLRVTNAEGLTATGSRKVEVRKKWKS